MPLDQDDIKSTELVRPVPLRQILCGQLRQLRSLAAIHGRFQPSYVGEVVELLASAHQVDREYRVIRALAATESR